jgi:maltose/maltodextrin transport system permease protein
MSSKTAPAARWKQRSAVLLLMLIPLWLVLRLHAAGEALMAVTLLVASVLALWAYAAPRAGALRYLFPGVAAALVFVVFPMLYTVGIAFTNHSSTNLLTHDAARAYLLAEATQQPGSARPFSLLQDSSGVRVQLPADNGRPAATSAALPTAPQASPVTLTLSAEMLSAPALTMAQTVALLPSLRQLVLQAPDGQMLTLSSLREFAVTQPLYRATADGHLTHQLTGTVYRADGNTGHYTGDNGDRLQPGYQVNVGWAHFKRIFTDDRFREPFLSVFIWTVVFAALSVALAAALGLVLAVLLNWDALPFKGAYRLVLFLPYAVPGFISILVFKGLFNQNLGEVNLILNQLFGIKPAWFSDPWLAKCMLVMVNVWLGFPYMMVLCSGLIKSIPSDLYEASAIAGAGSWMNFRAITLPLILKPLTPLLISAFAFNFNNFVLVSLLTGGRPDQLDASTPAGTTDILVSYTWRIAFQDSGQQFGLASAISTVIFLIVAAITLVQMRFTRLNHEPTRR